MPLNKMGNFSFSHVNQQDDLYKTKTAVEIKTAFDSQPNELKAVVNALIDSLQATTAGDSGAKNLGVSPISNVAGSNIQTVLEDLKLQINGAVAGSIPDGSITEDKLAFDIATDASSTTIVDTGNHFTATNVEGALDELFTSANSVKTNVSGAIGSPSTVNDTGAQLAGYITTEKGRIASEVGDGSSADTLKYLVDRLNVRLDELATNVNTKGVTSTSADTLAQLVTKVGLISTGKKFATGNATCSAGTNPFTNADGGTGNQALYLSVSGLTFSPKTIVIRAQSESVPWCVVNLNTPLDPAGFNQIMVKGSATLFRLTGNAYVNVASSFSLPVNTNSAYASTPLTWLAFE